MQQFPIKTAKQRALALIIFTLFHNVQHTFFFFFVQQFNKKRKKERRKKKKNPTHLNSIQSQKNPSFSILMFFSLKKITAKSDFHAKPQPNSKLFA